jgi:MSHA pilin protein MshD
MCIEGRYGASSQSGLTLVELVVFIVVIGIAASGVLLVMNYTTHHSADPQLRKQALDVAEALLEEVEMSGFTYCDPQDANFMTASSPAACASLPENAGPEPGNTRPYDNVNDYVTAFGTPQSIVGDVTGNAALIPAGYSATLTETPETLGGIISTASPASTNVLRLTVTVSYSGGSVTLEGYRTRYAPNFVP